MACVLGVFLVGSAVAEPGEDRFYVNGVYLFNSTTEADNSDVDFEGSNGLAGYFGYRVLPWLSLELGGVQFEPIDSSTSTTTANQQVEHQVDGYTVAVRGSTTFADLFDISLALGVYSWDSTLNYEITYPSFPGLVRTGSDTHSGEDVYYRVGVALPITDRFSLSVESAHFDLSDFFSDSGDAGNVNLQQRYVGVGVEYTF